MGTDYYDSEQRIDYASSDPTSYWGWYISWSGGESDTAYPFTSHERRKEWVRYVQSHFGAALGEWECRKLAVLLGMAEWGDDEGGREGAFQAAQDFYQDALGASRWEVACELASGFDPSAEFGKPGEPIVAGNPA